MVDRSEAWLVVIDPQRIFADPDSPWGAPEFAAIVAPIRRLAASFEGRTIVTRWLPAAEPFGSWQPYLDAWPFANVAITDPQFEIVDDLADLEGVRLNATTFGKYGLIERVTGTGPTLVLTGVATDCCVISTALAAADAGATVTVVSDACAGSSPQNQAAALTVMGLYAPQITVVTAAEVLAR